MKGHYWIDDGEDEEWVSARYTTLQGARADAKRSFRLHHTGDYVIVRFQPYNGRGRKIGTIEYTREGKLWTPNNRTYYRLYDNGKIGDKVKVN